MKNKIDIVKEAIIEAKKQLDTDPHLANYILRDLEITKEADLSDLSWALHREGCCKNDVIGLIEHIERYTTGASNAISQYEIADKYMTWHNSNITERAVRIIIRHLFHLPPLQT